MVSVDHDQFRDRWRGAAAWLDASPSEVAGLVVLIVGALAVAGLLWWTGRPTPVSPPVGPTTPAALGEATTTPSAPSPVTVHVAGAVATPGLVRLDAGSRVADALSAAGGTMIDADTSALNLAREVADGERLDVPRIGQNPAPRPPQGSASGGSSSPAGGGQRDGPINLNRASVTDLQQLPGIGPVLAGRIADFREANGPFAAVGQLRDVPGIGEKTFQTLAALVTV